LQKTTTLLRRHLAHRDLRVGHSVLRRARIQRQLCQLQGIEVDQLVPGYAKNAAEQVQEGKARIIARGYCQIIDRRLRQRVRRAQEASAQGGIGPLRAAATNGGVEQRPARRLRAPPVARRVIAAILVEP
jgi:hypothetical protein